MKSLKNTLIKNKNIIFRADLNVPVIEGKISDYSRINAIIPSINQLTNNKNKVFIVAHFGRPKGKVDKKYSLQFLCKELAIIFRQKKIHFIETFESEIISNKISEMQNGEICLFENIRFNPEEESNDINFSKQITKHFDYFINDAFSASHRSHASIVGFSNFIPAVSGLSFINEINNLEKFLNKVKKPNLAIIGGSKISTKIKVIYNLLDLFDTIVIGGAMANTFLLSNNFKVGKSLVEHDYVYVAKDILKKAKNTNCEILLPVDFVCAASINDQKNTKTCDVNNIEDNDMILDVGIETTNLISKKIAESQSVLWNGPLGAFEYKPFDKSSIKIANVIEKYSNQFNIETIAGGGDTISVINLAGASSGFNYLSNAGGAFLEWLEGNKSPGVIALQKKDK